jgi:hypothetical protein
MLPGVEEALARLGVWAKSAVGAYVTLRAMVSEGKGPKLRATTLAVCANADVHEFAGVQSVRGFASRLGITIHLLPDLAKGCKGPLIVKEFAFCDWPEVPVAQG